MLSETSRLLTPLTRIETPVVFVTGVAIVIFRNVIFCEFKICTPATPLLEKVPPLSVRLPV